MLPPLHLTTTLICSLAVNPKQSLPLYNVEIASLYLEAKDLKAPPPHIYAIAERARRALLGAYRQGKHGSRNMFTKIKEEEKSRAAVTVAKIPPPHPSPCHLLPFSNLKGPNQVIVVSGESGAGKTFTSRTILEFLSGASKQHEVSRRIVAANPVLEAFGNARQVFLADATMHVRTGAQACTHTRSLPSLCSLLYVLCLSTYWYIRVCQPLSPATLLLLRFSPLPSFKVYFMHHSQLHATFPRVFC